MKPVPNRNGMVAAVADSEATTVVAAVDVAAAADVAVAADEEENLAGNSHSILNGLCSGSIHSALKSVPAISGSPWSPRDFL
jgi:hypothetical protein